MPENLLEVCVEFFFSLYLPRANSAWTVPPAAVRIALDTPVEIVNRDLPQNPN